MRFTDGSVITKWSHLVFDWGVLLLLEQDEMEKIRKMNEKGVRIL